jgi:phosphate transport system substrate-binding protein
MALRGRFLLDLLEFINYASRKGGVSMKFNIKNLTVCAALCVAAFPTSAQDITLTSKSGGLTVSGALLAFDGQTYQVETDLGRITISDNDLTCQGEGCPSAKDRLDVFSLISTDRISRETLLELLLSFAKNSEQLTKQTGPFQKPSTVELSHRTDGLKSIVSFKSDVINLQFSANGTGTPVGYDAVQIISTAPALDGKIDANALRKIWQGEITNWNQLGGMDVPIRLILPIYADDLFSSFVQFDPEMSAENITSNVEYFLSPEAIIEAVSQTTDTIGLIYQSHPTTLTVAMDMGCEITSLPSEFTIQSMVYPLAFQLTMGSNTNYAPRTAKDLQAFAQTPAGQTILTKAGLIPLIGKHIDSSHRGKRFGDAIASADADVGLSALKDFKTFSDSAIRLATTLYFADNGRDLDDRSSKMLGALSAHLSSDAYAGKTILAVGFSDSVGGANANQTISLTRARHVQALLSELNVSSDAFGFGEVAPIGCNDSPYGRSKNKRVEIWVRD